MWQLRRVSIKQWVTTSPIADVDDPSARAAERGRRIILSVIVSSAAKGANIIVLLASIPMVLGHLGREQFGVWATLTALATFLSVSDFGVSNSLLTSVSRSAHSVLAVGLPRIIASAYAVITLFSVALALFGLVAWQLVDWTAFFNLTTADAAAQAPAAVGVFLTSVALANPASLAYRIEQGLQEGYLASIWQGAGNVATLPAVALAIALNASLPWIVLALVGAPVVAGVLNSLYFFFIHRPDLRPAPHLVRLRQIRLLSASGWYFLVLQLSAAVLFQGNSVIIARMLGAEAVTVYSVPERLFSLVTVMSGVMLAPFWPAFGEAAKRGDREWVVRTFHRAIRTICVVATGLCLVLAVVGRWFIDFWVDGAVAPSFALLMGLAIWKVLETWGAIASMLLNALGRVRYQALTGCLTAVGALILGVAFTSLFGATGVIFGTITAYIAVSVPLTVFCLRAEIGRLRKN